MRRSYISQEFNYIEVPGTFSDLLKSNSNCTSLLNIEDNISIGLDNIVWYENINGEQVELDIELLLPSKSISEIEIKNQYHKISLSQSQSEFNLNNKTQWEIDINTNLILTDYLFYKVKQSRSLEGLLNKHTKEKRVDFWIKKWISNQILNLYKFESVNLWLNYVDIKNVNNLKWNVLFSGINNNLRNSILPIDIINKEKFRNLNINRNINNDIKIIFNQELDSNIFTFDYYFDLKFSKI